MSVYEATWHTSTQQGHFPFLPPSKVVQLLDILSCSIRQNIVVLSCIPFIVFVGSEVSALNIKSLWLKDKDKLRFMNFLNSFQLTKANSWLEFLIDILVPHVLSVKL